MTSTPDDQQQPPAWGPQQLQPRYYPQQPDAPSPGGTSATDVMGSDRSVPGPYLRPQKSPVRTRFVAGKSSRTLIGPAALTAAVAASVAPFLRFWMERYSATQPGPRNVRLVISGFGHYTYHGVGAVASQVRGHDTNYAVPLFIAAITLAVAAVALVAQKGNGIIAMLLAVIGGSMLGAIAIEGAMDRAARSSFDSKYSQWSVGYGWWLTVFAGGLGAVVAITAAALVVKANRVPSGVEVQHVALTA